MAFWTRLEDRILTLQKDRPRMARYMQLAWYFANAFLVLGIVIILLLATGWWTP